MSTDGLPRRGDRGPHTGRVRVLIATTEGPVAVQKITAEDPDVPSVACRDGTTEVLAISRDYTRFVNRGTGLVAGLTGHGAYRLDLERSVDVGRSWQLPVLLAHLLDAEDRLAGPEDPAQFVLLATGEVDRDQRIRPVGRIGEKLAAARSLVGRHGDGGPPLVVLLPAGDPDYVLEEGSAGSWARILRWKRVEGLAALEEFALGNAAGRDESETVRTAVDRTGQVVADGGEAPGRAPRRRGFGRRGVFWTACLLLVLVLAGLAGWWTGPRHWEQLRLDGDYEALDRALRESHLPFLAAWHRERLRTEALPPAKFVIHLVEQRTTRGGRCASEFLRGAEEGTSGRLTDNDLSERRPGFFQSELAASLCKVIYRVVNESGRFAYAYFAVLPSLPFWAVDEAAVPLRRAGALPPGASLAIDLDLGRQPEGILGASLLVVAASGPAAQIRLAFEAATAGEDEQEAERAGSFRLSGMPALGLMVKGASHAILW